MVSPDAGELVDQRLHGCEFSKTLTTEKSDVMCRRGQRCNDAATKALRERGRARDIHQSESRQAPQYGNVDWISARASASTSA